MVDWYCSKRKSPKVHGMLFPHNSSLMVNLKAILRSLFWILRLKTSKHHHCFFVLLALHKNWVMNFVQCKRFYHKFDFVDFAFVNLHLANHRQGPPKTIETLICNISFLFFRFNQHKKTGTVRNCNEHFLLCLIMRNLLIADFVI